MKKIYHLKMNDKLNNHPLIGRLISENPLFAEMDHSALKIEAFVKDTVRDAPRRFFLRDGGGRLIWVVAISNSDFPEAVADWAARGRRVAALLDATMRETVVLPEAEGRIDGRSFAIWPAYETWSENKYLRLVQQVASTKRVLRWLVELARQTRQDAGFADDLVAPLSVLESETELPAELRRRVADLIGNVERRGFGPVRIAQHGDFWYGNVLQDRMPGLPGSSLRVIDWGTGRVDGYPFVDILTFISSLPRPLQKRGPAMMRFYMTSLGQQLDDAAIYQAAALGDLGRNLAQFPRRRYLQLVIDRFALLDRLRVGPA